MLRVDSTIEIFSFGEFFILGKAYHVKRKKARTCGECRHLKTWQNGAHVCENRASVEYGILHDPRNGACAHGKVKSQGKVRGRG
jgi:hypothetical protein